MICISQLVSNNRIATGGVHLLVQDDAKKKKELEELKNAEKKFQSLIQKRNELNDIARVIRDERDMLNEKRKDIKEHMDKNKKERDELVSKMKHHKELRNNYQKQAKEIIAAKQKKRGDIIRNLPLRVEELKADIQMLEYRQEISFSISSYILQSSSV